MKNFSHSVTPLSKDDLRNTIGGDGAAVDVDDLIGTSVIVEESYEI